jgi:Fe-S cluster assembly iron-binding protein IscA
MTEVVPSIDVTDKAKERLRAALAGEPKARFIRIDVGAG